VRQLNLSVVLMSMLELPSVCVNKAVTVLLERIYVACQLGKLPMGNKILAVAKCLIFIQISASNHRTGYGCS
jgi:hypothetical protein